MTALRATAGRATRCGWAGTRRRALVLLMVLLWCLLASPWPASLQGSGALLVAVLVAAGVALGRVSQWRAWRRPSRLDERETLARDYAYWVAFRGVGIGLFVLIVTAFVAAVLHHQNGAQPIDFATGPRDLVAAILLLALLPTVTLTWTDADPATEGGRSWLTRGISLLLPALAGLIVLACWAAAVWLIPPGTVQARIAPSPTLTVSGAQCDALEITRQLGDGLGAALTIDTNVCWNGRRAWDGTEGYGPPGVLYLAGTPPLRASTCSLGIDSTDFENISQETCTEQRTSSGTLLIRARARVGSGIGDWLDRTLMARLVVTAKGRVLS